MRCGQPRECNTPRVKRRHKQGTPWVCQCGQGWIVVDVSTYSNALWIWKRWNGAQYE